MGVVPRLLAHRRLGHDSVFPYSTLEFTEVRTLRVSTSNCTSPTRNEPFQAPLLFRLWHLASLDAPTVAIVWGLAFAWTANVRLPWWVLVLLSLGVWTVYVADRLLDARAGIHSSHRQQLRERHLFHWRYRSIFGPAAVASAIAATWIICHLMPRTTREHDSLLAAASLLYFTRVHSGRRFIPVISKELLVGIIFTLGCALPALSRARFSLALWPLLIATAVFALLAWLNCHAIDRWESQDANSARHGIALHALLLAAACSICSAVMAAALHSRSAGLLACSAAAALLLAGLDRVRTRFTPVTLRAAADLALLTPAMLFALRPLFCR
jgi:hypothetical protein